MKYTEEQQKKIDHEVCWAVIEAQNTARGDDERLHLGETVRDFDITTGNGETTRISGAVVEARHLAAIAMFQKNYGLGYTHGSITLRIEPPTETA
jgi:hypothetical protein